MSVKGPLLHFMRISAVVIFSYCGIVLYLNSGINLSLTDEFSRNETFFALNDNVLVYNRIPKTGSTTLVFLLQELAEQNKLIVFKGKTYPRHITLLYQIMFLTKVKRASAKFKDLSLVIHTHMHLLDFNDFNRTNPVYFNSVRDPIDKLRSRFNFQRRKNGNNLAYFRSMQTMEPEGVPKSETFERWKNKTFENCVLSGDPECVFVTGSVRDSSLAYFCGQQKECLEYCTEFVMKKVKENVERFYPVVAVLEHLEDSLKVAEAILPKFFKGAWDIFRNQSDESKTQGYLQCNL